MAIGRDDQHTTITAPLRMLLRYCIPIPLQRADVLFSKPCSDSVSARVASVQPPSPATLGFSRAYMSTASTPHRAGLS